MLHVYLPVGRLATLDAALELATKGIDRVIPISSETVLLARDLAARHPGLTARAFELKDYASPFYPASFKKPLTYL